MGQNQNRKEKQMDIKIYAHNNPVNDAFIKVVGLLEGKVTKVADQESADVVVLADPGELRSVYNDRQIFCVLITGQSNIAKNQPENVCLLNTLSLFKDGVIVSFLEMVKKYESKSPEEAERQKFSDIEKLERRYSVLVIDDTEENLRIAEEVLVDHELSVVHDLQTAVDLLDNSGCHYDAVLTDMEMPPDRLYPSLGLDHYGVTETAPYGFAVILEVTERGLPVAVVTDGNHHEGWVSAMFDHKRGATINGQKVLFFNSIGKRWDKALKDLMEG